MAPETWPAGTPLRADRRGRGAAGSAGLGARTSSGTTGSGRRRAPTPIRATSIGSRRSTASACGRIGRRISPRSARRAARSGSPGRGARGSTATAGPGTDVPLGEEREAYLVRVIERRPLAPGGDDGCGLLALLAGGAAGRRRRRAAALRGGAALGALRPGTVRKDRDRCLGLPNSRCRCVLPAQAQKHVTVNEALARLDAAAQLRVVSFAETTPPPSAVDGAGYAVPAGASGAWAGQGRPDRDLVQRRMDLPRAEGGMAGLGRGGGREPDLRRRRMGGERGGGLGGRRRLDLSGAGVRSLDRSGKHQPDAGGDPGDGAGRRRHRHG